MIRHNKHFILLICLILGLILSGCGTESPPVSTQPPVAEAAAQPTPETAAVTEPPEAAQSAPSEVPTEVPTEAPAELPYLQKVTFPDQSIYDGPGYDYGIVGVVEVAGTYTIVEEVRDNEGNLWGRLKSGAGWLDLTEVRRRLEVPEALSVNYADNRLLQSGNFHHRIMDSSEYAVRVAFRAHETLTDVRLHSMKFTETMELDEELFSLSRLEPDKPLVADLGFPGDMSSYAICFTDSAGNAHCLCVSISGRNGALELYDYAP